MSFVLSRMAACGGNCKNKVTVSKPVWDFLSKETPARLARLREEHHVSILIDGETSDIYVLQLSPQGMYFQLLDHHNKPWGVGIITDHCDVERLNDFPEAMGLLAGKR